MSSTLKGQLNEVLALTSYLCVFLPQFNWHLTRTFSSQDKAGVDVVGKGENDEDMYVQIKSSHAFARKFGNRTYRGKPIHVLVVDGDCPDDWDWL